MKTYISLLTLLLLSIISCSSPTDILGKERFDVIGKMTIQQVRVMEQGLGSEDVTPNYGVSLGTGIYPNDSRFDLETPMIYSRIEDGLFSLETEYFYTADDSLVRVIMYEWSEIREKVPFGIWQHTNSRKFRVKYDELRGELIARLGVPDSVEENSTLEDAHFRDSGAWRNGKDMKAYLFLLGNRSNNFRRLRLAVYRE